MDGFGPPARTSDPLRVLPMAAALVVAAIAGALIGFGLDLFHRDEAAETGKPPPKTDKP
ncbi:MAG: hypothetical protein P0Y56_08080 [Candidatus Andeanibacterium colombiense]|uniref:Uncharacterized protein n=1 Tax=Candidatus Andeanibacterium colombiense TaxID=3121345 RepID=A0AAJ5X873_9SPHN|nr:MAG: hypothetical protein P0Y56_08080 [Sphingomonadaceae bacterium]